MFYILYFFTAVLWNDGPKALPSVQPISVIVCAHNEEENLRKLIPKLMQQNYAGDFEIIVVDDRSADDTFYLLKDLKEKYQNRLKVLHIADTPPKMDPKKYALTLAIKAASFDRLLFTDADCYPVSDQWLQKFSAYFYETSSIVLGVSQYESRKGLLNCFIRYETLYTAIQYISLAKRGLPYMGVGRNLSYTKTMFFENKGFHPYNDVTGGDDDLFVNRVAHSHNTQVCLDPEAQIISYPKESWKEWLLQKTRHLAVSKLYSFQSKVILALLHFSHFFIYISFVVAIDLQPDSWWIVAAFFLRMFIIWIVFSKIITKLRFNLSMWVIPIFDVLFLLYYFIAGFNALRTKRIRWK